MDPIARASYEENFPTLSTPFGLSAACESPCPSAPPTRNMVGSRDHMRERWARKVILASNALNGSDPDTGKTKARLVAFENACNARGTREALKNLKAFAAKQRSDWILQGANSDTAQDSYIGRALCPGDKETVTANLKQHKEDMTSSFLVEPKLLEDLKGFCKRWAQRFLPSGGSLPAPDLPPESACFERRCDKGGQRGAMANAIQRLDQDQLLTSLEGALGRMSSDLLDAGLGSDLSLIMAAGELAAPYLKENPELPPHRVAALPERGLKARVVSSAPVGLVGLAHPIRKRILRGLKKNKHTQMPLLGVKDSDLESLFVGTTAEVVVSTDLTRATDLFPFELVSAVIDGLQESGKLLDSEVRVLRALHGPQRLFYPGEKEAVVTTRGSLMGIPTTWTMLSLIHLFWWDSAIQEVGMTQGVHPAEMRRQNRYAICGDDALFSGSSAVADRYADLVRRSGGQPSPGKHFVCATGRRRGVFLERLFTFRLENGRVKRVERLATPPISALVEPSAPQGTPSTSIQPRTLHLLQSIDSLLEQCPSFLTRLRQFVHRRVPGLPKYAKELGLIRGLPLKMCGYPLAEPSPNALRFASLFREKQARGAVSGLTTSLEKEDDKVWHLAEDDVKGDIAQSEAAGLFLVLAPNSEQPDELLQGRQKKTYVNFGRADKCYDTQVSLHFSKLSIAFGKNSPTVRRITVKSLKRLVRKIKGTVTEGIYMLPGTEVLSCDVARCDKAVLRERLPSYELWVALRKRPRTTDFVHPWWSPSKISVLASSRAVLYDALVKSKMK